MRLVQNKTCLFLWCLLLFGAIPTTSSQRTVVSGLVVQTMIDFGSQQGNVAATTDQIQSVKDFFVSQMTAACSGTDCGNLAEKIIVESPAQPENVGGSFQFAMTIYISLPDNSRSAVVKQSMKMVNSAVDTAIAASNPGFTLSSYSETYIVDKSRPVVCGDSSLTDAEACDDGNTADGDGCSSTCTLEPGYMCFGAWRDPTDKAARGKMTVWQSTGAGDMQLIVLEQNEGCTKDDICAQDDTLWDPTNWIAKYTTANIVLPQTGFYGKRFCARTFTAPSLYEFNDSCVPTGIDECSRGESNCDTNAYCSEPSDGVGYSCECDSKYFVSTAKGLSCAMEGVELTFHIAGQAAASLVPGSADYDTQLVVITQARLTLITMLIQQSYIRSSLSQADEINLVIEGALQYPIALKTVSVEEGPLLGRPMWRVILRVPDSHLNLELMATKGNIFDDISNFATFLPESYVLNTVGQCANDRARSCSVAENTCLGGGTTCVSDRPDFTVSKLFAGGSAAPLLLGSSGLDVMSVDYDITQSAFNIRMRYDNTVAGVMDTVYVSHMGKDQDPLYLPTFNSDEFPCLPLGTGFFQNQRDNSGTRGHVCVYFRVRSLHLSCTWYLRLSNAPCATFVQCAVWTHSTRSIQRCRALERTSKMKVCPCPRLSRIKLRARCSTNHL